MAISERDGAPGDRLRGSLSSGARIDRIRHPRPMHERLVSSLAPVAKMFTTRQQVRENGPAILAVLESLVIEPEPPVDPGEVLKEAISYLRTSK